MTGTGTTPPSDTPDDDLRRRLTAVRAEIDDHPLNDPRLREARALAAEQSGSDRAAVTAALRERGLPSLGRQSWLLVTGLPGLARLNRRRIRLEQQVGETGPAS